FTTNDLRYKVFRSIIRRRFAKHLYSILHPDLALGIGKTLSRSSRMRRLTRTDRELKLKGLEDYAHKQIQMHGHDVVVLGHSHEPVISKIARGSEESENYGYYVNCGDWIKHYTYVIIIDGIPDLKIFEQKEL
ncbi:MAG: UDP-2,3-diacylglucosamine hydrolase, partial [Candidatus Cloacimonetes bacterium]|nr:UDP-2,3-diacylglucosamine hydrolase [Candidatus Cloacimonadota bacterium]